MSVPVRTRAERKRDTLARLARDVDAWVATAGPTGGSPYLVPLSFLWDGNTMLFATPAASPTGRNLRESGKARIGVGPTRDLVLIEGSVLELVPADEVPADTGDRFADRTGFDPRTLSSPYLYVRIRPLRIRAWREADELDGRDLMRDGVWLAD